MDTALMTFMVQTSTATTSVHLIGSWDNFSKHYPMERDVRRAKGQWRGCYTFEDIICDGDDGGSSPKRTGGLKMGSTYYYYYELDNGTEHYDKSIPFTTSCPYLPGQPVNLLFVPIEVQPLRCRRASLSSISTADIKTMNPADKFMTPRQPPPAPANMLPRPNTSTSVLVKKRSARSLSPRGDKPQWSPRLFFGLRSPAAAPQPTEKTDKRGRSSSLNKAISGSALMTNLYDRSDNRKAKSVPHTRNASPQSIRSNSREPSPLRQFVAQNPAAYKSNTMAIQDEIIEEAEEDFNFADQFSRISLDGRGVTPLAPPPSGRRSPPTSLSVTKGTSKPLPQLPEETSLVPPLLRLTTPLDPVELPRSHFSISTISTSITSSPTESHFSFSDTNSFSEYDDLAVDSDNADDSTYSPVLAETPTLGFNGYSLPEADYASEQTIRKESTVSALSEAASRKTFGASTSYSPIVSGKVEQMSELEELLAEMGYLGDVIVGK